MSKKPVVLIIRDGWGENPGGSETAKQDGNAVILADTPFHDHLNAKYPKSFLSASGLDVGLPEGQMGNSEVGHLNLGAGRIIYQDLTRINKCINDDELGSQPSLAKAFQLAKESNKRIHLLGLVSDGGVHSHQNHMIEVVKEATAAGVEEIFMHAITDGRDTAPKGGAAYLEELEGAIEGTNGKIATVIGRYFAMDRDQRWERNKLAWDAIVLGKGTVSNELPSKAVASCYDAEEPTTDEFHQPLIFEAANEQRINEDDIVIFLNFRADRAQQLTQAFTIPSFEGFEREVTPKVNYFTMTEYNPDYDCDVIFPPSTYPNVLGEVVAQAGLKQLRIAETEKYPHVTYFFDGGVEMDLAGKEKELIKSPNVATYDLQPEMSADEVLEKLIPQIQNYDLVILNFANPDMVGHTGDVSAVCKAVEKIDAGVKAVTEEVLRLDGQLLITADHGNCELMVKPDGSPHTAHTTYPVQLYYVSNSSNDVTIQDGILADVAPTLLDMLNVEKPEDMSGQSLINPA